jgi:outer membrane lipoprotein-sorting protein
MKFKLSIVISIFSILSICAQKNTDAELLINNLLNTIKTSTVKTNFKLSSSEINGVNLTTASGTFTLKASKFVLEMEDTKAWYDGKTQWTYVASENEVSITEPTQVELAAINPIAILSKFKAKSIVRFSKTKSAQHNIIEFIPRNKKDDFLKVEVYLYKLNGSLFSINMLDKNGIKTHLHITNFQKTSNISDNIFVFNKANYKNVLINDLR